MPSRRVTNRFSGRYSTRTSTSRPGSGLMDSLRKAVPPRGDAARDRGIEHDVAGRASNLETGARFPADRVVQRSVQWAGNGRTGETALVHGDRGSASERTLQRFGKVDADRRQHTDTAAALRLWLDRVRTDQRNAAYVGFLEWQQTAGGAQEHE